MNRMELIQGGRQMITIRLPKQNWGKTWRAMIDVGPVRMLTNDLIFEVLPAHIELLNARGFPYEVTQPPRRRRDQRRHGTAD